MNTQMNDEAMMLDTYRNRMGNIVQNNGNERLTTPQIKERMLARAKEDPQFRREMFNHPKLVWALALEQQMGIKAKHFLKTIRKVEWHEEAEGVLYIKVPACHGGCKAPGVHPPAECDTGESCHVCGLPFKALQSNSGCTSDAQGIEAVRAAIESRIRERTIHEPTFRQDLRDHPVQTYVRAAQEIMNGSTPDYLKTVHEIVVLEEHPDEIHIIVPNGTSC